LVLDNGIGQGSDARDRDGDTISSDEWSNATRSTSSDAVTRQQLGNCAQKMYQSGYIVDHLLCGSLLSQESINGDIDG
jgi:hypothetical protein